MFIDQKGIWRMSDDEIKIKIKYILTNRKQSYGKYKVRLRSMIYGKLSLAAAVLRLPTEMFIFSHHTGCNSDDWTLVTYFLHPDK